MIDFNLPAPISLISEKDDMFSGNLDHYFGVGKSAMINIIQTLNLAKCGPPKNILDLPCGHGRVMRYLREKFPDAALTGCDLDFDAVDYCGQVFGSKMVYSRKDIWNLHLDEKYDLIWCASLLTHIDKQLWPEFFRFFHRHLAHNGVMIFSTHGRLSAQWLRTKSQKYGLEEMDIPSMMYSYRGTGFGYLHYPGCSDYGISVSSPDWIIKELLLLPDIRICYFMESGLDNHQDVFAFIKTSP